MCGFTACIALHYCKSTNDHVTNGHVIDDNTVNGDAIDDHTVNGTKAPDISLSEKLQASIDAINHRGPDETGMWMTADESIAIGHCRLSINDLSPSGRQPLHSDDNNIHAVVNGEIYDFDRLRKVCQDVHGYRFSGESDSELVLALYKIYGAPGFFEYLRGEFAFVLYDEREGKKRVIACRDRFGIKPLVYTTLDGHMLLASEAKAFLPLGWKPEWDVDAIVDNGWTTNERTLFKGVKKVLPGHWLEINDVGHMQTQKYWDAEYPDKAETEERSVEEMVQGVRERLVESVRLRLRADVPIGIYLSGGIDSSAIAGIVTELAKNERVNYGSQSANTRVACFAVRFPEASGFDESKIAARTADFLGVETITRDVNERTLADNFADTAYHCEHHHWDLNTVAKFALSTLPREHGVKVVLTGEGADEHFAGYAFFAADLLREPDRSMPNSPLAVSDGDLRRDMELELDTEMKKIWANIGIDASAEMPETEALADANGVTMPETLMLWRPKRSVFAPWVVKHGAGQDYRTTVLAAHSDEVRAKMRARWQPLHTTMYMWNKGALANTLLSCLGDRTEMAHSIEARTPFLDHKLAEYVNGLPPSVKMTYQPIDAAEALNQGPVWKGVGRARQCIIEKWILREAMRPYITKELYERRKHPFLAPLRWPENGPLHYMFKELLSRHAVEQLGFVSWDAVERSLERAFGEMADPSAFRTLLYVGAWVSIGSRFGVQKAETSI